jgi:hypothetical protein
VFLGIVAIFAFTICSVAQSTGALVGTVRDSTGAVVQGAGVAATDVLTGIWSQTKTNSDGDYAFPSLATGTYKLAVNATSLKPLVVEQIEIHVASTIRQDATLSPASVSTSVEVISSTPLLDSETAEVGQLVEADQITELPLNGRDIYNLLTLTAGAESNSNNNSGSGFNGYESPNRPSIAGERAGYTVFRIDDTNVNTQGLPQAAVTPNVDAVQEFRSITQLGSAADSGPGSVFINLRSGTNKFHGAAYDFLRNNVLDAEPYFYEPAPPITGYSGNGEQLRYNQFGGTVGGPIWRNRTFFMGSTQILRATDSTQARNLYPTAAMLTGDFSGINPATQQNFGPIDVPGSGGSATFAGNQVPIISPLAKALIPLAFKPANCMSCLSSGLGIDSVETQQSFQNETQTIAKIEHHLSDKDQISGSYTRDYNNQTSNPNVIKYWTQDIATGANIVSLREAHTFTANLLNTFNLGFVRFHQIQEPAYNANGTLDFDTNMTYNVPRLGPGPVMDSGGYPWTIAPFVIFNETDWSYDFNDNFNWTHGHHNIAAGFEAVRDDTLYAENWNALLVYADGFGSYGFTNYEFSDFEQGVPLVVGTQQGTGGTPGVKRTVYETYFQDDWKVAPRLTIDAGLRYELPERWRDVGSPKYNRIGTLDTSAASMANGGQFLVAGSNSVYIPGQGIVPGNGPVVPDGLQKAQNKNIQPRLGLAYRPFDDKTVIRGGFGIYYALADEQSVVFEMESPPWQFTNQFVNATVSFNLPNPFGYSYPIYPTYTDTKLFPEPNAASGGVGQKGIDPRNVDGRAYQWSLSVERQLSKSFKASAEYVGNENAHLPTVVYVNQPGLPNATQLAALEANPANDATAAQARAPFTGITPGYEFLESVGTSSYNALYLVASGQLTNGLTLSTSYIWSKSIDLASSEDMTTDFKQPSLGMNRSLSLFNHPERLIASWVYKLPFGDTVGHTDSRALNQIISGWETSGIASFEEGYPYSVYSGVDTAFLGAGNSYPNLTGPLVHSNIRKTSGIYLTPQNFTLAPWGTFGTTRRNQFTGPGVDNFDLGFMRNFKIMEGLHLQVRGELFNAFNHGQFQMGSQSLAESDSPPSGSSTTPTVTYTPDSQFGRVSQSASQPSRIAQVAAKIIF